MGFRVILSCLEYLHMNLLKSQWLNVSCYIWESSSSVRCVVLCLLEGNKGKEKNWNKMIIFVFIWKGKKKDEEKKSIYSLGRSVALLPPRPTTRRQSGNWFSLFYFHHLSLLGRSDDHLSGIGVQSSARNLRFVFEIGCRPLFMLTWTF